MKEIWCAKVAIIQKMSNFCRVAPLGVRYWGFNVEHFVDRRCQLYGHISIIGIIFIEVNTQMKDTP